MPHVAWSEWTRGFEVEPSLYAADFARLGEQVEGLLDAGVRIFHVDIGDGHFIPPVTIGPVVVASIASRVHGHGGRLDCHLMVESPERHFAQVADAGGDSVTFHVEAVGDPQAAIALARESGLGVGVAFNPDTPVEEAVRGAAGADLVTCMSVHPGYSGQAFIADSLERVRRLRDLLPEGVLIQVDGGVGAANVREVHVAGADLAVAGSAVFSSTDPGAAYAELVSLAG